jgi:tetratricopeptide (TPR) repeat protein
MIAGAHAAVAVPLAVARARACAAAGEGRRAAWRFAGAALLLLSVGAGGSLGAVAAALAGTLAVAVTSAPRPGRRAIAVGLTAALALGAALALSPAARRGAADHLARRAWGWQVAAAAVRDAPLLGHGPGDWPAAFYEAQGRRLAARPADLPYWTSEQRPHATLPGRAVEDGLPAAGLLAVALLAGLAGALRRRAPVAGAWVALAVTSLYAFPLRSPPTALLLPLLLLAAAPPAPPGSRRWPAPRLTRAALAAAGALLVAWAGVRVTGDALRLAGHPQAALRVNPTDPEAAFAAGVAALAAARPAEAEGLLSRALARRPGLAAALMAGNAALAAGDLDAAERWYALALRWHPAYSLALHNRAWVAALRGDLARARALAAEAVRRNPANPALRPLRELLRE